MLDHCCFTQSIWRRWATGQEPCLIDLQWGSEQCWPVIRASEYKWTVRNCSQRLGHVQWKLFGEEYASAIATLCFLCAGWIHAMYLLNSCVTRQKLHMWRRINRRGEVDPKELKMWSQHAALGSTVRPCWSGTASHWSVLLNVDDQARYVRVWW